MFYIWTAIKFLKKALVSLVLMKSFVSPRQHIPCGEGCFPPISDIVNSHRDSQGTCYSCCILFFSKGTRNPTIQHIPLACTWSGGCQTKCQACKAGISPEQTVSAKNSTSSPKGGGEIQDLSSAFMPSKHMQASCPFQKLCFSHPEIPALLTD